MRPVKHSLGFGNGRIVEYEDGTVAYIKSMEFSHAFRVSIADVTGFSVINDGKMLERTLRVMGGGSVLASVSVNHGVAERVEEWFRAHPSFRTNAPATTAHVAPRTQSPSAPPTISTDHPVADPDKPGHPRSDQALHRPQPVAAPLDRGPSSDKQERRHSRTFGRSTG